MRVVMQAKSLQDLRKIVEETNKQTQVRILWAEREAAQKVRREKN